MRFDFFMCSHLSITCNCWLPGWSGTQPQLAASSKCPQGLGQAPDMT